MKATQQPPTDVHPTPADVLRGAARYLQRHGWTQHYYYAAADTNPFPPACAVGAIGMAATGRRAADLTITNPDQVRDYNRALDAFAEHLNTTDPQIVLGTDDEGDSDLSPFLWNDADNRTREQVIAALNAAADAYDRTHTTTGGAA